MLRSFKTRSRLPRTRVAVVAALMCVAIPAQAVTTTVDVFPVEVPDEMIPRSNTDDAPPAFGPSSWQGPFSGKSNFHARYVADGDVLSALFPADAATLTIGDLASITYYTKRPTGTPAGRDWWVQIYTRPKGPGMGDAASWYHSRYINNYDDHTSIGSWSQYSTDVGMTFNEQTPPGPEQTLAALKAADGADLIEMISIQTDSGWNGFDGYVDGVEITLTNGEIGRLNLETDTSTIQVPPWQVPDEELPRVSSGNAPAGFGPDSWQGPATGKSNYHARYLADGDSLSALFPADAATLTIGDLQSISYSTKRPGGTPASRDWWVQIYTRPKGPGMGDAASWYHSRYINNYNDHTSTGSWVQYSTDGSMTFNEQTPPGPEQTLAALKAADGADLIEMISIQTDSGWNGFDGYVDGVEITLTNGTVGRIDLTAYNAPCNEPGVVGGGELGLSPGPVGPPTSLGFDVGAGQCNGSFAIVSDPGFPGGALELAMRAEQRGIGQVTNNGGDYTVAVGPDPTNGARAWWNFQHSIAYQGDIDDLDALTFDIRTDVGTSVPATPADMLALRGPSGPIDDRNNQPNPTSTYADLYQTSQNPVFGWLSSYDMNEEGAWKLTLTAERDGSALESSICIHTPAAACETCSDGILNQDESDVDCGGSSCVACLPGDTCNAAGDCDSAVCTGGVCQAPTCSDGVQNQDETDVDCGGITCDTCTAPGLSLGKLKAKRGAKLNTDRWSMKGEIDVSDSLTEFFDAIASDGIEARIYKQAGGGSLTLVNSIAFAPGDCAEKKGNIKCKDASRSNLKLKKRSAIGFYKLIVNIKGQLFDLPLAGETPIVGALRTMEGASIIERGDEIGNCSIKGAVALSCKASP